ncbi:MAG: site-2 protease family protein, partial [Candidatus Omnitrophota bacterium]
MLTFLAVIIVFSIVILVHELGHFLMARRMGVKVEKFSLGLGKTIFSKKKGDTE